ncbi:hypothetical protein C8R47DRAFT_280412 [Mycena vitilis]|nr:hypothetical protein C8R47DRAFT_280412 [Mycena vitilis]
MSFFPVVVPTARKTRVKWRFRIAGELTLSSETDMAIVRDTCVGRGAYVFFLQRDAPQSPLYRSTARHWRSGSAVLGTCKSLRIVHLRHTDAEANPVISNRQHTRRLATPNADLKSFAGVAVKAPHTRTSQAFPGSINKQRTTFLCMRTRHSGRIYLHLFFSSLFLKFALQHFVHFCDHTLSGPVTCNQRTWARVMMAGRRNVLSCVQETRAQLTAVSMSNGDAKERKHRGITLDRRK